MDVSASDPSARALSATQPPASRQSLARPQEPSTSFGQVLRGLSREIDDGEKTMRTALGTLGRGAELGPAQLIALQAGVYRYSEAVDLASHLVDRATSGVKTIVQGGGQ